MAKFLITRISTWVQEVETSEPGLALDIAVKAPAADWQHGGVEYHVEVENDG